MAQKMPVARIDLSGCPSTPQWYTVVTNYNYEKKYATDLMQGLKNSGLDEFILEVVVPIKETTFTSVTKTGKQVTKTKVEKIYPLYVFVKAIMNERVWDYIRTTTGAHTVLATSGYPSIMSEEDIKGIKNVCGLLEKEKKVRSESFKGKVGDKVRIDLGPFSNYVGVIKSIKKEKATLQLENGMPIEIDVSNLDVI